MSIIKIGQSDVNELVRVISHLHQQNIKFCCEMVCGVWEITLK